MTDPTPTAPVLDAGRIEEARADLDWHGREIDNGDAPYNPAALAVNRAAETFRDAYDAMVRTAEQHRRDAVQAAESAIGLYREYVETHGHDPDQAAAAAVLEVQEGVAATEELVGVPGASDGAPRSGDRVVYTGSADREPWLGRTGMVAKIRPLGRPLYKDRPAADEAVVVGPASEVWYCDVADLRVTHRATYTPARPDTT